MPKPIGANGAVRELSSTQAKESKFSLAGTRDVTITEPSDVVALAGGAFLVVSDEEDELELLRSDGSSERIALEGLKGKESGLEGIAYDPGKQHLFVASEERNELLRYELDVTAKQPRAVLEKRFDLELPGAPNKGVEGLCYLPAKLSPSGDAQLVLAKEGKPKMLGVLAASGKGSIDEVILEQEIKDVCQDFSGLTVDPKSGHLFVCSDESAIACELVLSHRGGRYYAALVHAFPLRDGRGQPLARVEGVACDDKGDLWVLTENERKLYRFARGYS